jgi:S-adenosylmethionine decarboxylase
VSYHPGLHLIADFQSQELPTLSTYQSAKQLFDQQIAECELVKVGEVYHNFPGGGFTGVVCLAESHLSIHTWPEHGRVTFDVFLSNYLRVNDLTTRRIYEATLALFRAYDVRFTQLSR